MKEYKNKPMHTSQYDICPIPFKLDTYKGCTYNCLYCFARNITVFNRRNNEKEIMKNQQFLENINVKYIENYINKNYGIELNDKMNSVYQNTKVFLNERIPLKIGAMSDPCPLIEKKKNITGQILEIFDRIDYPIQILTKNPEVLLHMLQKNDKFISNKPNLAISISMITTDDKLSKKIESGSILPSERIKYIKELTSLGYNVLMKYIPAIYPYVLSELPNIIPVFKDIGAWAVTLESLKIRIVQTKLEKMKNNEFFKMMNLTNYDIKKYYTTIDCGDKTVNKDIKLNYNKFAWKLCKENNLKFFSAENFIGKIGDGYECCGTEILRNYKLWMHNERCWDFGLRYPYNKKHSKRLEDIDVHIYGKKEYNIMDLMKQKYKNYIITHKKFHKLSSY